MVCRFWVFTLTLAALVLTLCVGCYTMMAKAASTETWELPQDAPKCAGPIGLELEHGDGKAGTGTIRLLSYAGHSGCLPLAVQWERLPHGNDRLLRCSCTPDLFVWLTGQQPKDKQPQATITLRAYVMIDAEYANVYWLTDDNPWPIRPFPPDSKDPHAHLPKAKGA